MKLIATITVIVTLTLGFVSCETVPQNANGQPRRAPNKPSPTAEKVGGFFRDNLGAGLGAGLGAVIGNQRGRGIEGAIGGALLGHIIDGMRKGGTDGNGNQVYYDQSGKPYIVRDNRLVPVRR